MFYLYICVNEKDLIIRCDSAWMESQYNAYISSSQTLHSTNLVHTIAMRTGLSIIDYLKIVHLHVFHYPLSPFIYSYSQSQLSIFSTTPPLVIAHQHAACQQVFIVIHAFVFLLRVRCRSRVLAQIPFTFSPPYSAEISLPKVYIPSITLNTDKNCINNFCLSVTLLSVTLLRIWGE